MARNAEQFCSVIGRAATQPVAYHCWLRREDWFRWFERHEIDLPHTLQLAKLNAERDHKRCPDVAILEPRAKKSSQGKRQQPKSDELRRRCDKIAARRDPEHWRTSNMSSINFLRNQGLTYGEIANAPEFRDLPMKFDSLKRNLSRLKSKK
jgi:hypothetical protein